MVSKFARLLVLPTSDVNAPGLLTGRGWGTVYAADYLTLSVAHPGWAAALREVTLEPAVLSDAEVTGLTPSALLAQLLGGSLGSEGSPGWPDGGETGDPTDGASEPPTLTPHQLAVWLVDGDLVHEVWPALAAEAKRAGVDADLVFASPELPGAQVTRVMRTIDLLRGPRGCPWVRQQTHESVLEFVVEEAEEVTEAYQHPLPDPQAQRDHVVQELGDLLFQVLLHGRLGAEEQLAYTVDDAANALNSKLIRRNPHIFKRDPAEPMPSIDEIVRVWNEIKAAEKAAAREA
ncbi:hypothetical protein JT358_13120 [Micrococcales bacterium 31B]|nr:hypothetical protein [Micrococcales bacterium 31B]